MSEVVGELDALLRAAAPDMLANVPANIVINREILRQSLALNMISYKRYVRHATVIT